ncbi:DUF55-domain-containing protein [Viridothelium virens]|uniref:Thymocyte nuclear protein 1 n=1 Tax=Viridothelium virens TaxID=1048519 RepID=A0A6A6GS49_VIRVR|nr:DUF55-domain-containing protein [Viridothelium virens]
MGTSQIEKVTKRQPKPETDGTPAPSRGRGRPPKKVTETPAETEKARPGRKKRPAPTEDEDEADKEANGLTETAEPEPKRQRGRPSLKAVAHDEKKDEANEESPSYWLMKAEPESRLEKGIDVKFSIDDLEAATEPEPWNGVRNHVAKNNMKAMKKGERAFFYHSNCKTPGIVGIMEIVQEASPDESAFVETDPYYDPKAKRDNPTGWVVVHVEFRQKFDKPVTLEQLKNSAKDNKEIENMQLLKQSRLSVSKVSSEEWGFILRQAGAEIIPDKVDEVMNLSKNPPEVDGIATNSATLGLAPTQESKSSGRATSVPAPTKHSSAHPKKAGPRAGSRAQSVPPSAPTPETGPAGPHSETPISQAMARVVEEQET